MSAAVGDQGASLLEQILSGQNRNLQVLAGRGLVPLPPEELIPIQVALTGSPDTEIAHFAVESLSTIDTGVARDFVETGASERELRYFGLNSVDAEVRGAIIRRSNVPRAVLEEIAPILPPDLQEMLVLRQDAILERPEILLALERNEQLSRYTKRRIWEYREHLLPRDKVPAKTTEEIMAEADTISTEELEEAFEEVRAKAPSDDGEIDENVKLTPAQVRLLPVPMRVKIARQADRQMRTVLIRDASSQVAVTVITANALPDSEVEAIANNRSVCEEVLAEIPKKREWIRKYSIAKALVKNPKTRLPIAMKLVPRMSVKDLRELAKDKNVADGVRQMALRLYQNKR